MSRWRLITDEGVEAAEGLALDEGLMSGYGRERPDQAPALRLYTYRSHCALVGRYQHLQAELDLEACRRTSTAYNRRPTGGGAIIMGSGQLGVAMVTRAPADRRPKELLESFSEGIVAGLASLGVRADFRGKNDLTVGGRKIAGLGLYLDGAGALLFHASVLADLDIDFMLQVLDIPAAKLGERGAGAVAERITTVSRETGSGYDGRDLVGPIARGFETALGIELQPGDPAPSELQSAERLLAERYGCESWWHEYSPRADATSSASARLAVGAVRVYLALNEDTIKSILFTGDFNAVPAPLVRLEERLRWARADRDAIAVEIDRCLSGTEVGPAEALLDAVMEAVRRAGRQELASPVRQGSCYFPEMEVHS